MSDKLLVTGSYLKDYPRNKTLIKCLSNNFQIKAEPAEDSFINLKILKILFKTTFDKVLFLWPVQKCWPSIIFAKILRKQILLDFFWSDYEGYILDRQLASKKSFKAMWYRFIDKMLLLLSNKVIFDTTGRADFFREIFTIATTQKFLIWPVIPDLAIIDNIEKQTNTEYGIVKILFYGHYIPLQGIETIIEAAKLLSDDTRFKFQLIGNGQTKKRILNIVQQYSLSNIAFIDTMPYDELIKHIKSADICLGIFGKTPKAQHVVPNKILDYLACSKPVITSYNTDLALYFKHKEDIYYCTMADPVSLKNAILHLTQDLDLRNKIGRNGRATLELTHNCEVLSNNFNF